MPAPRPIFWLVLFLLAAPVSSLPARESNVGEGEHRGQIVNREEQILRVGPVKPGQTLELLLSAEWSVEERGKVEWVLTDTRGTRLRTARHHQPETEPITFEWTSNSEPNPSGYLIHIRGMGGSFPGELLGHYFLNLSLKDQNDGGSGTDAPERYEKALNLPISEPGFYFFDECFLSATADVYDLYRISVKPNHVLTLEAKPLQWKGDGVKAKVRWEFSNRSLKRMKEGQSLFSEMSPFVVKIFHPQTRSSSRPAVFYLLVKIEGEVSLVYTIQAETKEGR
jgi:hypothetical protein